MSGIYDQHAAAFRNVSAFIIAKDGERVASVAIKFPKDGASRLYAYVHWNGLAMVRGSANGYGYGYDKRSAAVSDALCKLRAVNAVFSMDAATNTTGAAFCHAAKGMDAQDWTRALEAAGFTVWQAV